MIQANPALQVPSSFYDMMRATYIESMSVGVRRLVDWDRRSISFVRLMDDIADHPEVISRPRFVRSPRRRAALSDDAGIRSRTLSARSFMRQRVLHPGFDRFAGVGGRHVRRSLINSHKRRLVRAHDRLRRFVNKHVAHTSQHPMRRLPTFADLDACIDLLEELLIEYVELIEGKGLTDVLPVWQYDWKAPFRVAWLP